MLRKTITMGLTAAVIIMIVGKVTGDASAAVKWPIPVFHTGDSPATNIPIQLESTSVNCDASYPDVCIASPPPDLNCDDIADKSFTVMSHPHGFDRDNDGIGCE